MMDSDTEFIPTDPFVNSFIGSEKLWLEDADTVFCAGKTKFRLHSGIIATQSTIMAKNSVFKREDGIDFIYLEKDNEKDLYCFFMAIVYGS